MTFLNPSILIGLLAVSIPILIHLLNLRKIRKVEFSTLMFLKELQKSKMRRIKLRQLILLLLRIMAITFLVLCFANPVYEGFAGNKDNSANKTALIYIDDSFSMSARDDKGQFFAQAKDAVKKILETHKESDDVYLIPVSKIEFKKNKILFDSYKELLDSLDKIKISYKPADINEIMNHSQQVLNNSKNAGKEIFIISDFQKNNFNEGLNYLYNKSSSNNVNTYLIKIGNREISNLSLDSFAVVSKIIEKDKDIKVRIFLNNHSGFNVKNKTINLYVDNELRGEKVVDVNSFDKKEVDFVFKSNHSGNVNAMLELSQSGFQDDEIIQDNRYYFSLYIPDRFTIGLIEDNQKDFYFIRLALQTASDILSDSIKRKSELFNVNSVTTIDENIFKNDVVFISNKRSFTDNEANILKDFVSNGGGLFLFLGSSIDVNNYNNTILKKLNSARIEKLNTEKEINQNLKFDRIDFENPVLSEIFSNQKLSSTSELYNIESPKISSYYEILPNESSGLVITLSNSRPFLLESKMAKGRILISSVSASDDLSDMPLKSIFVPLIIRSVYYLSNNFEVQGEYTVGKSNLIPVRNLSNISQIILADNTVIKTGNDLKSADDNYLFLPYDENTTDIGRYSVEDSSGSKFDFSLNNNPKESNILLFNKEELIDYFKNNGIENVKVIDVNENISESVKESGKGLGLWKYFLIGAILFIISELLLSKKIEEG